MGRTGLTRAGTLADICIYHSLWVSITRAGVELFVYGRAEEVLLHGHFDSLFYSSYRLRLGIVLP